MLFNKKFYLKEDADKVIAELTNKLNNARANRETGKLAQPKPPKILDTFAAGKCCELVGSTPYFARYKTK